MNDPLEHPTELTPEYLPRFSRQRLNRQQWIWATVVMTVSLLICAATIVLNVVRVSYVSHSPGSVYSTPNVIEVDTAEFEVHEPDSEIGFVTVGVSDPLTLWQFLFDSLDDRITIYNNDAVRGGRTPDQVRIDNQRLMQDAQSDAAWLALLFLGLVEDVQLLPSAATRECIFGSDEADGALPYLEFLSGDLVKAAAIGATGELKPIAWTTDLYELLVGLPAGETVRLQVERGSDAGEAGADSREVVEIEVQVEPVRILESDAAVRREFGGFAMKATFENPAAAVGSDSMAYRCLEQTWYVVHQQVEAVQLWPASVTQQCIDNAGEADDTMPYVRFLPGDLVAAAAIGNTGELLPIAWTNDLYELLAGLPAGETLRLQIERGSDAGEAGADSREVVAIEAQVELVSRTLNSFIMEVTFEDPAAAAGSDSMAYRCLGQIWFATNQLSDKTDSIRLDSGDITGPSAGLAFTLTAIDLLSQGNLIGDLKVAVTGSVEVGFSAARVRDIGGVAQKTTAVRQAGYDVFLVPKGNNYDEALAAAGDDLLVVGVDTVGEALAVLACLGGDPVQPGRNYQGPSNFEALNGLNCVPGWQVDFPSVAVGA